MVKLLSYIFVGAVIAWSLFSCSNNIKPALIEAENIMEARPDSALKLLESIEGTEFSKENQALYALLLSQAYDKNFVDLTNDSLISIALNHYLTTDDAYHTMLAYHYRAAVNRNAGFYESSLSDALKAYDFAMQLNDDLNQSRTASLIGKLYSATYNFAEAITWESIALEKAKVLQRPGWIYNGYMNIGEASLSIDESDKALEYADSAYSVFNQLDNDILELRYFAMFAKHDYAAADSIFKLMEISEDFTPSVQLLSAQCTISNNVLDKYKVNYNDNIIQEHIAAKYIEMQRHFDANDYAGAIQIINELIRNQNAEIRTIMQANLLKIQTDHEADKATRQTLMAQQQRRKAGIIIIFCATVIVLLLFLILYLKTRNDKKQLLQENKYLLLSQEFGQLKQSLDSQEKQIADLFISQFSWIEKVGDIYIDATNTHAAQKVAYKKLEDSMQTVRSATFLTKLESLINQHHCNIIARIRTECPKVVESEISLIILLYAGLSTRIIAFLLNKNENAIYSQKHRIRRKFEELYPTMFAEMSTIFV